MNVTPPQIYSNQDRPFKNRVFLTDSVHKKSVNSIGSADTPDSLSDCSSYVAKLTLIDLYHLAPSYLMRSSN